MTKYYVKWLDTEIPALGNLTPRKAAKLKSGKEILEALFLDFERSNDEFVADGEEYQVIDVAFLRKELGMDN